MSEEFSSWVGIAAGIYILVTVLGIYLIADDRASRANEEHPWHEDGLSPWTKREYRKNLFLTATVFPAFVLSAVQVIAVPFDLAPGQIPLPLDPLARGAFSLGVATLAYFSGIGLKKVFLNKARLGLLRIAIALTFFIALGAFPWVSRTSQWYRPEVYTMGISFAALALVGLYIRRRKLAR